ncbi:hypothetical protein F5Y03DRAFT_326290 [Xylaria venustula]|nr:hypothetical protein F5Y03DRAFT_326290 [Xylaria venustula]
MQISHVTSQAGWLAGLGWLATVTGLKPARLPLSLSLHGCRLETRFQTQAPSVFSSQQPRSGACNETLREGGLGDGPRARDRKSGKDLGSRTVLGYYKDEIVLYINAPMGWEIISNKRASQAGCLQTLPGVSRKLILNRFELQRKGSRVLEKTLFTSKSRNGFLLIKAKLVDPRKMSVL